MSRRQDNDKQQEGKFAERWLEEHADELPPDELAPLRAYEIREDDEPTEVPPPKPRISKKDAPHFDEDLGRVPEWNLPEKTPTQSRPGSEIQRDLLRWSELAARVADRLVALAATAPDAIERVLAGDQDAADQWYVTAAPGLAALEELNRELWPNGWRAILRDWFEQRALATVESAQRDLPSRRGAPFAAPARHVPSAGRVIATLRSNPPNLMGEIPAGLTPEILEFLAQHVTRGGGGRSGGWTPDTAVNLAEQCARDPNALRVLIEKRKQRKQTRAKKAKRERGN